MGDRRDFTAAFIVARAPGIAAAMEALSLRERHMLLTVPAWYQRHHRKPGFLPTKSISIDSSTFASYTTLGEFTLNYDVEKGQKVWYSIRWIATMVVGVCKSKKDSLLSCNSCRTK